MIECAICGFRFILVSERHYISRDPGVYGLSAAFGSHEEEKIYDSCDCPQCGCQIILQERKRTYNPIPEDTKEDDEE